MKILQLLVASATLMLIAHGQQQNSGFITIDCGAEDDFYNPNPDLYYETDRRFISTGVNKPVSPKFVSTEYVWLNNLRAFPNGTRNCYTLTPLQGKGNTYLIRAAFVYGNYDGLNQAPSFDLYIDANYWSTINSYNYTQEEIIYAPPRDDINVCLVNTGFGNPFISVLNLRPMNNSAYRIDSGALRTYSHSNVGERSGRIYRHPEDVYDRIWDPYNDASWVSIANDTVVDLITENDAYEVPAGVLMTAGQSNESMEYREPSSRTNKWYAYFHFTEIQFLQRAKVREIEIHVGNQSVQTVRLQYGKPVTIASFPITSPYKFNFTLRASPLSALPPILNAFELMYILDLPNPMTDEYDVKAVNNIKKAYVVTQDHWQGDPCSPSSLSWSGVNCSDGSTPRIISLNLSSINLTGGIADAFMNLSALTSLDLSNNQLTGQIPKFFGQMPNLRLLNLSGNNLSGSIPRAVKEKQTAGTLQASFDGNPYLCRTGSCGKKANTILIVAVSVSVFIVILLGILTILWRTKRRRQGDPSAGPLVLGVPKRQTVFTSSEISTITNNFGTVIGQGGFGKVYLGKLDDGTAVAVKMSSKSSEQSDTQFLAEAQMLSTIHHRNLVSLVGYCNQRECMALVYEFMSKGNLRQHLSENSSNVLDWRHRLQVAVSVAQGLEYLHDGCRPSIIHRDMKTSNILLDETMQAKISDFGLSKAFATEIASHINTRQAGTPGYLDPEYVASGNLTKKSDVYSFGVILFELITGQPAVIRTDSGYHHRIIDWVTPLIESGDIQSIVDQRLSGQFKTNSAWGAVEIAMSCVVPSSKERPDMNTLSSGLKECLHLEIDSGYDSYLGRSTALQMTHAELDTAPSPR